MNTMVMRRPFGLTTFGSSLIDDFFEDLFESFRTSTDMLIRRPVTDIFYSEDGKMMHIEMEVPGYDRDTIQIHLTDGLLEIRADRSHKEEHTADRDNQLINEGSSSFFSRIALPEGADTEKIEAEMENGILSIGVPLKQPEAKRVTIAAPKSKYKAKLASFTEAKQEDK